MSDVQRPLRQDQSDDDPQPLEPQEIVVDAEPGDELIENADESVERAGW